MLVPEISNILWNFCWNVDCCKTKWNISLDILYIHRWFWLALVFWYSLFSLPNAISLALLWLISPFMLFYNLFFIAFLSIYCFILSPTHNSRPPISGCLLFLSFTCMKQNTTQGISKESFTKSQFKNTDQIPRKMIHKKDLRFIWIINCNLMSTINFLCVSKENCFMRYAVMEIVSQSKILPLLKICQAFPLIQKYIV